MNKKRLVAGLLVLSLVLCITVAGSILVVDSFSETKISANYMTNTKSVKDGEVLKSTNDIEKLAKSGNDKKSKKDSLVLESNKTDKKTLKNNKKQSGKKKYKSIGTFKVTGYCSCASCCNKTNGITASGTKATAGRTIAADTSKLPFGTKVVIDGHTYTVEDRGGAITGNKIDVFFSSHSKALQWGVRYCEVYIVK